METLISVDKFSLTRSFIPILAVLHMSQATGVQTPEYNRMYIMRRALDFSLQIINT